LLYDPRWLLQHQPLHSYSRQEARKRRKRAKWYIPVIYPFFRCSEAFGLHIIGHFQQEGRLGNTALYLETLLLSLNWNSSTKEEGETRHWVGNQQFLSEFAFHGRELELKMVCSGLCGAF
jgi:hypothetical protein